ncbi:LOW QUALITY PROTEIN: hypothetical protein V2J09_021558, partial [Rumex salicifolius]
DFNRVWESNPYHVFSQLLLLKPWYSVRLHSLLEEFANPKDLTTIIEGNFTVVFIRMDPSHNSNRMNMFTRFCINTDVALNIGEKSSFRMIIVIQSNINYGLTISRMGVVLVAFQTIYCPNRAILIRILRITIRTKSIKSSMGSASKASSSLN